MNSKSWLVVFLLVATAGACTQTPGPSASDSPAAAPSAVAASAEPSVAPAETAAGPDGALTLVADRSLVCMVNDQFMGQPQIPIEVEGRTYYGCCEMCKTRLGTDPTARSAIDPVTNRPVDKAVAVIGKTPTGAAVYFETEESFAAYARQSASK